LSLYDVEEFKFMHSSKQMYEYVLTGIRRLLVSYKGRLPLAMRKPQSRPAADSTVSSCSCHYRLSPYIPLRVNPV